LENKGYNIETGVKPVNYLYFIQMYWFYWMNHI
jgi:hypothetical protein